MDNAVSIDVEGHLDLRDTARRWGDANQVKLPEQLIIRRHLTLALEDPDRHRGLIVRGGREDLALLGRDCGILFDQPREHPT